MQNTYRGSDAYVCSQYNSAFLSTIDDYISQLSDVEYSYVQDVELPLLHSGARQENYRAGLFQQHQQSDVVKESDTCEVCCAVL
ncbi:hypothetical protein Psal006b_03477 (plasmid) [Piscirickettsia salmonis]|nr:hypothetical protein Psal006b_03477 [Piscirickettsia salmonis]